MKIPALPTSNVGMLPRVLEKLENDVLEMHKNPEATTNQQRVVAWAVASVGAFVFAALDQVVNAALIAVKVVPVAFNVTIGKLTGLSKFITSPALTGEDFVAHFENIRRCLLIQLNAVTVFFFLGKPGMVATIARDVKLLPIVDTGSVPAGKTLRPKEGVVEQSPIVNSNTTQAGASATTTV